MATFIVLFIMAAIIAVIAEISLQKYRQANGPVRELGKEILPLVADIKEFGENLLTKQPKPDLSAAFRTWATQQLGQKDAVLKSWLGSMAEPGLQALTRQLAHFCAELNLDLAWLVSGQLDLDPTLKQTMHEVVVAYCWGCWKAVQVQPEIELFRTFTAIAQDPTSKSHQAVSQKLLAELRKHDLAPEPDPGWFLAPERQRRDYLSQIIRQAAEKDHAQFYRLFQDVVRSTPNGASAESRSEAAPSKATETQR